MTLAMIPHFSVLARDYEVVLSDVWGVIHNGIAAYPKACDALGRFRANGGRVVLITNAPRPYGSVERQLDHFGVPRDAYDAIASSGDVTRAVIEERSGQTLHHIGPDRDKPIFEGLPVRFAPLEQADYVVCTGLDDDDNETPEDYRARLEIMHARNLFMVCANPDVVVGRGRRLVYCAGAIADLYGTMGGEVLYAGKPYRPIYDLALAKSGRREVAHARILAIGDSVRTDLKGAQAFGIDCVFLTAGIHSDELGGHESPDLSALENTFGAAGATPKAVMSELVW
jgi:HAD superfamily hydrolase (TIGR01459 family)